MSWWRRLQSDKAENDRWGGRFAMVMLAAGILGLVWLHLGARP